MSEPVMEDCPFCGWKADQGEYAMMLHMETYHAEGDSHFVPKNGQMASSKEDEGEYAECPVEGCVEILPVDEMEYHVELHVDEAQEDAEPRVGSTEHSHSRAQTTDPGSSSSHKHNSYSQPRASSSGSRQQNAIQAWKKLLNMPSSKHQEGNSQKADAATSKGKRLGRAQLGKYAHEERMPDWLVSLLQKGGQIDQPGIIPVLEQLLQQSSSTKYAYLCHPSAHHVSKLKKEGGFCGYRNIQMMTSYIIGSRFQGHRNFKKKIPSIFQIQDFIEEAWDRGINSQGRIETGGIKGTRKYIGTPEALAMLRLLDIPCDAQGFKDREPGRAEALLMEDVENYFKSGVQDPSKRIRQTNLPPIYFQHPGHSMTIVGFERQRGGVKNLIVFDPMFHDSWAITRLVDREFEHPFPDYALKPYRRGSRYLKKYREFEVLRLRPPTEQVQSS